MEELSEHQYPRDYFDPFGDELDDPETEALLQCDSCCDWFPEDQLIPCGPNQICRDCLQDLDEDVLVSVFDTDEVPDDRYNNDY